MKKGFTLIELLAVIIIIGILSMLIIPNVSRYIDNSKKETYKNAINEFGKYVKVQYATDYAKQIEFNLHTFNEIESLQSNVIKSPYGEIAGDYTYAINVCFEGECDTFIQVIDNNDYGIELTSGSDLSNATIEKVQKKGIKCFGRNSPCCVF